MRTLKYKTPKAMERRLDAYFANTPIEQWTVTGLCLALKINKDTFYEYAKREGYSEVIDWARLQVEHSYELSMRKYGRSADIFAMKNFGWKDKIETENELKSEITISFGDEMDEDSY